VNAYLRLAAAFSITGGIFGSGLGACSSSTPTIVNLAGACGANPCPASADGGKTIPTPDAASPETDTGVAEPPVPEWAAPVVPQRSPACGVAFTGAKTNATYTTASGRTFHVWAPQTYEPGTAYPVATVFHGWYTNATAFQSWFRMDERVGNDGLTVYPDSDGGTWDINGDKDILFFDEMMKLLGETYCINPAQVFGFGYSYGAIFMNHLGCNRAGYLKAIGIGDGSMGGPATGCGRLPVLISHRTYDPDEVIASAYANRDRWKGLLKCTGETDITDTTLNCTTYRSCKSPGALTFCEDSYLIKNDGNASYEPGWEHTVRPVYQAQAWSWFKALR
jgi:poly(3-hydroxybutyrate) depolymerase